MTMSRTSSKERLKRLWLRTVFFVPLCVLILERILGTVSVMHDLSQESAKFERLTNDEPPLSFRQPILASIAHIASYSEIPLSNLTRSYQEKACEEGLGAVKDVLREEGYNNNSTSRRIPKIIHQTGRSRCMTRWFTDITKSWRDRLPDYEYYFHDDEAIDRLLNQDWPEFPHLPMVSRCLDNHGTAKADLWRYVVLWEYGGVYADLDTSPNLFNMSTLTDQDDGFFVIEQYHLLSQYFMAVSPRHPVMLYTIHQALFNLMELPDTGKMQVPQVTGPRALHMGFQRFMKDVGTEIVSPRPGLFPVAPGHYMGTGNRSLVAAGIAANENEYVRRESIPRFKKVKEYAKMDMKHFTDAQKDASGVSCRNVMLEYAKRQSQMGVHS